MTHLKKIEILITGATGTIGSEICRQLSEKEIPFRAMSRSEEAARSIKDLRGVEMVIADFNDKESLKKALKGIKHAFLLTNSSAQAEQLQSNFIEVAEEMDVEHIVKQSQLQAEENSPVRFLRYHALLEKKIKAADIHYTFLRPNLFMQALLGFKEAIRQDGKFYATLGEAKVSVIDIRDIAAVAVEALQGRAHYDKTYTLTGPEALTHAEIAQFLTSALNHPIEYENTTDDQMRKALLQAGFPNWQVEGLIEDYAHYGRGEAEMITNTVEQVTGKRPYTFGEFVNDYTSAFTD